MMQLKLGGKRYMSQFRVNILFRFVDGPWGGGNQFLKSLRSYFLNIGIYEENSEKADVILFNSHHCLKEVYKIKTKFPNKILIHRVDGPVFMIRGSDMHIDKFIFTFNQLFADGTIFQSRWSLSQCQKLGMYIENDNYTVIMNAPDPQIFNTNGKKTFNPKKVKLIATSWSSNYRKGFDIYSFLDKHLDFARYEMTFVGNSPVKFKNITTIAPIPPKQLAMKLKEHDIFITASQNDPCSNALIEALHCGLPAVARKSGGHPEIIKGAGELFDDERDVISAIEKVASNYYFFRKQINLPTLNQIGEMYLNFMKELYIKHVASQYKPKSVNIRKSIAIYPHFYINTFFKAIKKVKSIR